MENGVFEATLTDVDRRLLSFAAGLVSSPSKLTAHLPSLEEAAQSLTGLSNNQMILDTPAVSSLLSAIAARASRAEALLETAAAFHMGCLTAHTNGTGDYPQLNHDGYIACSPSLVRVEG